MTSGQRREHQQAAELADRQQQRLGGRQAQQRRQAGRVQLDDEAARDVAAEELDDEAQQRVGGQVGEQQRARAARAGAAAARSARRRSPARPPPRRAASGAAAGVTSAAGRIAPDRGQLVERDAAARERDRPGDRRRPCRSSSRRRSSRAGRRRDRARARARTDRRTTRERPALAPREPVADQRRARDAAVEHQAALPDREDARAVGQHAAGRARRAAAVDADAGEVADVDDARRRCASRPGPATIIQNAASSTRPPSRPCAPRLPVGEGDPEPRARSRSARRSCGARFPVRRAAA